MCVCVSWFAEREREKGGWLNFCKEKAGKILKLDILPLYIFLFVFNAQRATTSLEPRQRDQREGEREDGMSLKRERQTDGIHSVMQKRQQWIYFYVEKGYGKFIEIGFKYREIPSQTYVDSQLMGMAIK